MYFLRDEKVAPVRRTTRETPQVATAAVQSLLAGPQEDGFASAVPDGTELHGIVVAGGTATVDVSSAFSSGGGSLSMQARLAQLVYTVTQFPTVERMVLRVDGKDVLWLGGEGIDTSKPLTRADFEDVTPGILVEFPLPGDLVELPFTARGTSNTFEATHQLQVVAADNGAEPVFETHVTATSGSGERGTWQQEVDFELDGDRPRDLVLRVFEASAEDGSETKVVEIPITLD